MRFRWYVLFRFLAYVMKKNIVHTHFLKDFLSQSKFKNKSLRSYKRKGIIG